MRPSWHSHIWGSYIECQWKTTLVSHFNHIRKKCWREIGSQRSLSGIYFSGYEWNRTLVLTFVNTCVSFWETILPNMQIYSRSSNTHELTKRCTSFVHIVIYCKITLASQLTYCFVSAHRCTIKCTFQSINGYFPHCKMRPKSLDSRL